MECADIRIDLNWVMLYAKNTMRRIHILCWEMGVNAVRLAHYQQSEDMYDLMDKTGIIAWAEIPFVGPGGYDDKGFVDFPDFREMVKISCGS